MTESLPTGPDRAASPSRRAVRLGALAVVLAATATFAVSLRNDFTFDDLPALRDNAAYDEGRIWPALLTRGYFSASAEVTYRPVVTASYALDHALWTRRLPAGAERMTSSEYRAFAERRQRAWRIGLHATNLTLHAVNSALVFLLALRLRGLAAATVAGLLFAVHPVQAEAVNAAGYREDLLAAFFVLAGTTVFLTSSWRGRAAAAAFCYLLGLLSKESAALMPAGLFALERLARERPRPLREMGRDYLPFAVVAAVYLLVRFGPLYNPVETRTPYPGGSLWTGLLTALPTLARYAWTVIAPVGLSLDYGITPSVTPADWRVWGAALALGVVAWGLARWTRRRPLAVGGVLWCGLMLLPTCHILPIPNIMADRYLYLPLAGLALAAGALFAGEWESAPPERRRRLWAMVAIAVLLLAGLSYRRSLDWRDQEALCLATLRTNPQSLKAWLNLGNVRLERGDAAGAEACYRRMLELRATSAGYAQLGQALEAQGRTAAAQAAIRAAHALDPGNPVALQALGMIALREGRHAEAVEFFRKAAGEGDGPARADLGTALALAGRMAEAEQVLREALAAAPRDAHVWGAWGNLLFRTGRDAEAVEAHRRANALRPGDPNTHLNLGAALASAGRDEEAVLWLAHALAARPDADEARYNLALCLARMGRAAEAEAQLGELLRRNARLGEALGGVLDSERGKSP